jgi:hypothetical protein
MTQEIEGYLSSVKRWMFGMPRKVKKGIIEELRGHIMESAQVMGGPSAIESVVRGMEPPRKMAKRYKQIYGYGLFFKILFVIIIIFLSIWTVPVWEVAIPDFSTTFVFLILIVILFLVGSKAGKRMALVIGFSAFLTRFIVLGLIAAAAGEYGIIQGGGAFVFFLSSVLLVLIAYLPARTIEKWEERKAWDIPMPQPYETSNCPRCEAIIPVNSKFCQECGGRVY